MPSVERAGNDDGNVEQGFPPKPDASEKNHQIGLLQKEIEALRQPTKVTAEVTQSSYHEKSPPNLQSGLGKRSIDSASSSISNSSVTQKRNVLRGSKPPVMGVIIEDSYPLAKTQEEDEQNNESLTELLVVDIPPDKTHYLHMVFPLPGIRPPIIHGAERNSNGFYHLYAPPTDDNNIIGADEHWCLYRSKSEVVPKYRDRIIKWHKYLIGAVPFNVAICK